MKKKKFNYITEVLDPKAIEWMLDYKSGFTLVVAPTGTGKSTFIIEDIIKPNFENENHAFGVGKYSDFAKKKILVMANRTAVVLKFNEDVEKACEEMGIYKSNDIAVASYQKVTSDEMLQEIDEADIIICDEAHYLISDAWNGTTPIITEKVLVASEKKPVIFFTATPQLITKYFNYRGLVYKELDYRNVLGFNDRMDFICTNKSMEQILKDIPKGEKALIYVADMTSRKYLKQLKERLSEKGYSVEYYHSVWERDQYGRFTNKKNPEMQAKVSGLVVLKKFDTQIALANKAIDNGIDLKDNNLKHIVLMNQYDHVQIQQMVGRKRFDINNPKDRLKVWFTTANNNALEQFYIQLIKQVKLVNDYSTYHYENFDAAKIGLRFLPSNKNKSDEEISKLAEEAAYNSFIDDEDTLERTKEVKMKKNLIGNDEYRGLLRYQLGYIAPLVSKYLIDVEKEDGTFETTEKQNIVKNYQELVRELFQRPSEIQWRNKDEAHDEEKRKHRQRCIEELEPYLESLEGIKLYDGTKQDFQSQISFYFGASKRSNRYAGIKTIKELVHAHDFTIDSKRMTVNGNQRTIWVISKL